MSTDYTTRSASPAHSDPIAVLKFGSSVLRGDAGLHAVVAEIYRELRRGYRVLAVVSAFPGVTDRLAEAAARRFESPDPGCLARLLSTGESASAALVGMALEEAGVPAAVLDPDDIGLEVAGPPLDSDPVALDDRKLRRTLNRTPVVVLPGLFGRTRPGNTALLGRGGSDFTALFAAASLGAEKCRLLKDVDGVYSADPGTGGSGARYSSISWDDALDVSDRLIQPKALRFARARMYEFSLTSLFSSRETLIGSGSTLICGPDAPARPLRIGLLGLGTVGLGVFQSLAVRRDLFELTGIAVCDLGKPRDPKVPRELLTDNPWELLRQPADVVIELIGGVDPAASLIHAALALGRSVVTANKAVLARDGEFLERVARREGVRLLSSASVGGSVPVLERIGLIARGNTIERVSGVLNGTCNYVLERLGEGVEFSGAIREAQERGFAEADPRLDLSGADSAHKLAVLARAAFGTAIDLEQIRCRGIEGIDSARVRGARSQGRALRLVATCRRTRDGIHAEVRPRELPLRHPLSRTAGVENRVLIRIEGQGSVLLTGKGAGRRPTSLSVFADVLELLSGPGELVHSLLDTPAPEEMTA